MNRPGSASLRTTSAPETNHVFSESPWVLALWDFGVVGRAVESGVDG